MSTLSIKSRNPKSAAPKKGSVKSNATSRRKVTSPGQYRRNDAGDRLAAAQRARVPGGHGGGVRRYRIETRRGR